ncbi:MAG: hypothetical protein ACKVRN_01140 [Pyrinomonadaceae bacterium]
MKTRNYNKISIPVLTIVALIIFSAAIINAQPGSLDPTFGKGGVVITRGENPNHLNAASAMAIQSDGKIVVVGDGYTGTTRDFAVVRYNTDGSLDSSFGGTGIVLTPVGNSHDQALSVAIQADGKIVVAGGSCNGVGNCGNAGSSFAVVRYNPDGSLDTSFNGTGMVTTPIGNSSNYPFSVALQTDGKIVAAGYTLNGSNSDFALVRYNTNGSLDLSFSGGIVITPIGNSNDSATSVAVQADGKIVAAGRTTNDTGGSSFAVVRYTTFGQLDPSFGIVTTSFGNAYSGANALTIQWDGKIVAAGYSDNFPTPNANADFALIRLNSNGKLDASFGGTGKVIIPVGNSGDYARSVAIQADGSILAAGYSRGSGGNVPFSFALVRVRPNGSLDTTFNGTGLVTTPTCCQSYASAVSIQPDGKIVVAGGIDDELYDSYDIAVVRYQGGPLRVNGKIAFTSDRDGGNSEIYLMNSDGSNQVRLTNNNVVDQIPAFSPDGRKIAYVSQQSPGLFAAQIKIMNSDGTNQTVLTSVTMSNLPNWQEYGGSSLSWSPDGSKIAFDDEGEIFTINIDGTNRTNLTNHPANDIAPAWSPDGNSILFDSSRVGYSSMHIMKTDGSDVKALPSEGYRWDLSPGWSPSGDKIIFTYESEDFPNRIFTADADGSNRRVLVNFGSGFNGTKNKPRFSPDSTKIVFQLQLLFYPETNCEIYVKNVNGSGLIQLTNTIGNNGHPSWAPQIRQISPGTAAAEARR